VPSGQSKVPHKRALTDATVDKRSFPKSYSNNATKEETILVRPVINMDSMTQCPYLSLRLLSFTHPPISLLSSICFYLPAPLSAFLLCCVQSDCWKLYFPFLSHDNFALPLSTFIHPSLPPIHPIHPIHSSSIESVNSNQSIIYTFIHSFIHLLIFLLRLSRNMLKILDVSLFRCFPSAALFCSVLPMNVPSGNLYAAPSAPASSHTTKSMI
jgi:hypothetical protein